MLFHSSDPSSDLTVGFLQMAEIIQMSSVATPVTKLVVIDKLYKISPTNTWEIVVSWRIHFFVGPSRTCPIYHRMPNMSNMNLYFSSRRTVVSAPDRKLQLFFYSIVQTTPQPHPGVINEKGATDSVPGPYQEVRLT